MMENATQAAATQALRDMESFDHPFRVTDAGTIVDDVRNVWAPEVFDEEVSPANVWEPITGYSGQDSYSGPVMHNSEYLGGGMLRDMLERPGVYVCVACYWADVAGITGEDDPTIEGWMLLRLRD